MRLGLGLGSSGQGGRGGFSGGHEFSPLSIAGLVLWLRADLGITLNGSNVSAWANQGSLGGVFSQGSASSQPLFVASDPDFAGKPSVSFDDTNDVLGSTLAASNWAFLSDGMGMTFVYVLRGTGGGIVASTQNISGLSGWRADWNSAVAGSAVAISTDDTTSWYQNNGVGPAVGVNAVVIERQALAQTPDSQLWVNGVVGSFGGGGGSPDATPANTLNIGALDGSAALPLGGKIPEIIAYNHPITEVDRLRLSTYLSDRYS